MASIAGKFSQIKFSNTLFSFSPQLPPKCWTTSQQYKKKTVINPTLNFESISIYKTHCWCNSRVTNYQLSDFCSIFTIRAAESLAIDIRKKNCKLSLNYVIVAIVKNGFWPFSTQLFVSCHVRGRLLKLQSIISTFFLPIR